MVPLKSGVKGQRVAMASRMLTQALPLVKPEAPLVQTAIPDEADRSFEDLMGKKMGAVRSKGPGTVRKITDEGVEVAYDDGSVENHETYHNFPFNRKTYLHNTPLVKPGQRVEDGSLLAKSNYTDDTGATALGANARVAYLPFKGLNFEDAVVISESMANKMSSEHMYQHSLDTSPDHKMGRKSYISLFPGKYDKKSLEKIDDDGVITPGTTVDYGSPLILGAKRKERAHNKVHKKRDPGFADATVTWDHHQPGVVTDVLKTKKGPVVLVKAQSPMQVGDKLSGRYGDKGVISRIVPDDQMPHDKSGAPYEVLLNPLGIISRTNPAQMIEAALGKIAAKTGKPVKISDFEDIDDLTEYAIEQLKKHGLSDMEDVYDPETERKLKNPIFTGNRFFMKLHHTAEGKGQGRGTGGYTMDESPAKGGATGSKRIALLDTNALLSHGATQVLRDAGAVRGQRNEEYWMQFMQGNTPRKPKVPFQYEKFVNQLKASGINVVEVACSMKLSLAVITENVGLLLSWLNRCRTL
jgi:DNA-directed RNA polymerase subunit beta